MQDLNDLYYFVQVVEHGGFAPAARALGLQKSKLSRRVALLEGRLGVRLLQRSPRRFSVTEVGHEYYRRCVAMLAEAKNAQTVVDHFRSAPQGLIRMACPPGLLAYRFGDAIAHFLAGYPKVEMQVKAINRAVDPIGEGYDVAIRTGLPAAEPATLVTRKLGEVSQCLVAAPALLDGNVLPEAPADLSRLPSLDFAPPHPEHPQGRHEWCLASAGKPAVRVSYRPRLTTDDLFAVRAAALAGIGVAQLPSLMIEADLKAGRLVELLPAWRVRNETVQAIFPSRRGLLPSIRALLDFLAAECRPYREGTRAA
ncbi:MAG TPA: LysR substrate-binding domain-containing protein [Stellaceae bacterium]|jgi:DNA-binding transcriptional LysR family regulator